MRGSTAASSSASLASSWPTTAENGNARRHVAHRDSSQPSASSSASHAASRSGVGDWPAHMPRSVASSSRSAIDRSAHGFDCLEELPHRRVGDVGLGDPLVHPVLDDLGGGVVAEQVVDGGGQLEGALVAVAAAWPSIHFGLTTRVRTTRAASSASDAHPGPGRVGGVAEPGLRASRPVRARTVATIPPWSCR